MPSVNKSAEARAIRKLDVAWGKAASDKDLDALVDFYASDGSLVWTGQPAAHGRKAIRSAWAKMMKIEGLRLKFTPRRITVSDAGDLAIDFGRVDFGQIVKKRRVNAVAKYLVVWKKVRRTWKVLYDSYNYNSANG